MRAPQTTIYMDAEMKAAIDAARGYMSRSEWIRRAIFAALDGLRKTHEEAGR